MARNLRVGVQRGLRQSIGGGLGTGDIFTLSPASFDFARTSTKDSRITFSRASSATYVAADGLIKTTPVNLLTYSEEFDNASWFKSGSFSTSQVANAAVAPDGSRTAEQYTNASSGTNNVRKALAISAGDYTFSIYLKAATVEDVGKYVTVGGHVSDAVHNRVLVQLPAEWTRFTASGTFTLSTVWAFGVDGRTDNFGGMNQPREESTFYVWGAQLEEGSNPTEYIPTTSTISGAPRFDHDPATGESLGLLIEEARTNLLTNSEDFSSWSAVSLGDGQAPTTTIVNSTAPDGSSQVTELTLQRTTANTSNYSIFRKQQAVPAAITTASIYVKASTASDVGKVIDFYNNQGSPTPTAVVTLTNEWQRVSDSGSSAVTTTFPSVALYTASASTGVVKVLIWGAQLEQGSFPTSYIPTSGSTVTRAADVAEITGTNFSDFYNQSEGTMFVEAGTSFNTAKFDIFEYSNGTVSNRYTVRHDATTNKIAFTGQAGVTSQQFVNLSSLANIKAAATQSLGFAVNGVLTGDAGVSTSGTKTQLAFGYRGSEGGNYINGHIKRLIYFPTRLPDATLKSITS